jgi:enoyl-CoA hydratase
MTMSRWTEVKIETGPDSVAVVRLDAPERRNALTGAMARELTAAVESVGRSSYSALVLTGTTEAFCAGADVALLERVAGGAPDALEDLRAIYRTFEALDACPLGTVAAICGPAVGAGLNLALACDVRVVGDNAYLRSMFVANDIHPAGNHLRRLLQVGGEQLALYMGAFDQPVRGASAVAAGLAVAALPPQEVESHALRIASGAAANSELTRLIKSSVRAVAEMADDAASALEAERQLASLRSIPLIDR